MRRQYGSLVTFSEVMCKRPKGRSDENTTVYVSQRKWPPAQLEQTSHLDVSWVECDMECSELCVSSSLFVSKIGRTCSH